MAQKSPIEPVSLKFLPNKKLTVNHENIPSSVPSIISTDSSFVLNGVLLNNSLTEFSKFSASTEGSNRKPAVAFNISGVFDQYSSGISFLASSNKLAIVAAP